MRRYRDEVAARQAEAERLLWIRAAGEAFPPVVDAARARFGNRPGSCSAPRWRRRRSGCRAPAPPRRPPPGRCSRAFAAFPCWPASTTRRRWPTSPSPSGRSGRRSGRKSRGCCAARTRRDDRPLDSAPQSKGTFRAAARFERWKCRGVPAPSVRKGVGPTVLSSAAAWPPTEPLLTFRRTDASGETVETP